MPRESKVMVMTDTQPVRAECLGPVWGSNGYRVRVGGVEHVVTVRGGKVHGDVAEAAAITGLPVDYGDVLAAHARRHSGA